MAAEIPADVKVTVDELGPRGVRMEIVLAEPTGEMPPSLMAHQQQQSPTATGTTTNNGNGTDHAEPSAEEIQRKLDEAAERRNSLLLEKRASIGARLSKVEEAQQRKQELLKQQQENGGVVLNDCDGQ